LTPQHERWAEALAIEKRYGGGASTFLAARIAVLACSGDEAGVARMRDIAGKLALLSPPGAARQ
jgi:hypothetical protein